MATLGGYQITGKIGEGGMATVYKGTQLSLNRPVAVKVLSRKLADHYDVLQRFNRESLIIARLAHPNIIHVIDRGITSKGMPYFVMEYVQGTDLAQWIRKGGLDLNRKLDMMIQVCRALSYAHKNGVVHRDIKPANILIDGEGIPRVLDFGIAQLFRSDGGDGAHTQVDVVMGTPAYMSPEQQTSARSVTAASDLYSLGVVMYELFTGRRPLGRFQSPSVLDPTLPKELDEVILRCLAPEPRDRFANADEIKDRLLLLLRGAHLANEQRERAGKTLSSAGDKFALLDVIKEDRYGAAYLYEDRVEHKLMVLKKRVNLGSGYTEAKLLTTLKHPNIVNVLGTSRNDQLFILVMEYVSGGSLRDRLIQPLPWGETLRIARQVFDALSFAHRNRIVHGNLRPSNILFAQDGTVKLTDFGLDEHYGRPGEGANWYNDPGEPPSMEADILAAGTIVHQMLSGKLPTWHGTRLETADHIQVLPPELQEMIHRMLARAPQERFANCDQVVREIDALLANWEEPAAAPGPDDAATVVAVNEAEPAGQVDPQSDQGALSDRKSRSRVRPWPTFLLLLLLLASAGYALHQGGQLTTYLEVASKVWARTTEWLGGF